MACFDFLELSITHGVIGHLRHDTHAEAERDIGLDDVGIEGREHDIRRKSLGGEGRVDLRTPRETEVVGDNRVLGKRFQSQGIRFVEWMALRHEDATVPRIAGQGRELGEVRQRFGGNADVDFRASGLLRDLNGIALM